MILIPAIDIKNNCCVRLKKGVFSSSLIFSKNPVLVIDKWISSGAKRLHIVDLDGAYEGKPKNLFTIKSILNFVDNQIPVQIGGGIRSFDMINYYFDLGISYIILGTKAILDIDFFYNICVKYPNKIILSLDLKNNKLALSGWHRFSKINLFSFLKKIKKFPFESIVYTDIERDGTLTGLNLNMILSLSKYLSKPIIASGGLSSINDLKKIFNLQKYGILGLICGKAIYTGNLDFYSIQKKISEFNSIYIK